MYLLFLNNFNQYIFGKNNLYIYLDGHSMASASQHINPSIAPSIGEVSLAMTNRLLSASASHLERSGLPTTISMEETDRDSASRQVVTPRAIQNIIKRGVSCSCHEKFSLWYIL